MKRLGFIVVALVFLLINDGKANTDTVFFLINPNFCSGSFPVYNVVKKELIDKKIAHVQFILSGVRKRQARQTLEEIIGKTYDDLDIVVDEVLFMKLAGSLSSGVYLSKTRQFYPGFQQFWEGIYDHSGRDTILISSSDDFHVPKILSYNNGVYYCMDTGKNYLFKVSKTGEVIKKLNLTDILDEVRIKIGSVTPENYLKKIGFKEDIEGKKTVPDATGYNKIVHIKGPTEHISKPSIHIMLRAFEIDAETDGTSNVLVNQFPLKNFEVFLEFDTSDFSLLSIYRLPELKKGWRYNVNAFLFTTDSTLILPVFPENEEDVYDTPVFAQLKLKKNGILKIDKFINKGLTQFAVNSGWHHFFFNPIFITVQGDHYYIDQAEMCFYRINDPDYRWCIPELPGITLQEILTTLRVRTPIDDFRVSDDFLHMWIGIFEDIESKKCDLYYYRLDVKNKKVQERKLVFSDTYGLTSGYRWIDGTYHKLFIDEADEMRIVRFTED